MVSTMTPTVAATRQRALALPGVPSTLRTGITAWRVTSGTGVPSFMRGALAYAPSTTDHNSIPTAVVVPVADRADFVAAKQAAPPRGVPR